MTARAFLRSLRRSAVLAPAAVLVMLGVPASPALGNRVQGDFLQAISGPSPFLPGACGVPGQFTANSVGEPSVAVNPRDPNNIIAVWQQDRFVIDGGALSNLVGVSRDGGKTWRQVQVPGLSRCTGGVDERTSDPWISIGPDGTAYLATLTFTEHPQLAGLAGPTAMRVSRSTDGGATWTAPATVVNDNVYDDRESITADPHHPGTAYMVWVRRLGVLGEQGTEYFSRTSDGGATFSTPRPITALIPGTLPDPALIRVLPNGTLVNLYLLANASPFLPASAPRVPWLVMAQRSGDQGATWSAPTQVGAINPPSAPMDPSSGAVVRAYNEISADVAPDGTLYVAWNVIHSQSASDIVIARSNDGASFSAPRALASPATQAFLPTLAVAGDGTVGVTWDDLRNNHPGSGQLTTDVWLAHSHDGGLSWSENHVAGSFDTLTAPPTDSTSVAGRFLGDFQGLAGLPQGFAAVFSQGKPQAVHGGSDLFFSRLDPVYGGMPPAGDLRRTPSIRVRVSPAAVRAGARTVFHFVISARGHPLRGALIRFAGMRVRSDARGQAHLRVVLPRVAAYVARVSARGYRAASARVVAQPVARRLPRVRPRLTG